MSHEVRTPLNAIIGYGDLLLDELAIPHPARRHAMHIRDAGAALLLIVDDVLDISRIEAGRIEINPRPFELGALIEGTLAMLRALAEAKGLSLEVVLAPDVPAWLTGDPGRLGQVLLNLLGNAIKFTADGQVTLAVASIRVERASALHDQRHGSRHRSRSARPTLPALQPR